MSSSFICMAALAMVTRLKIYSYYPAGGNVGCVQLCNCELSPRTIVKNDKTIHIMCSREGSFDIRRGVIFHPNHFVPLFIVSNNYNKEEKNNSETIDPCVSSIKAEGHSERKLPPVNPPKNPLKRLSNQPANMNVKSKRKTLSEANHFMIDQRLTSLILDFIMTEQKLFPRMNYVSSPSTLGNLPQRFTFREQ